MSKKTNAEKLKRRATNTKRKRKGTRGNPPTFIASNFTDPILMHHIVGFIMRTIELSPTLKNAGMGDYPSDSFTPTPSREIN